MLSGMQPLLLRLMLVVSMLELKKETSELQAMATTTDSQLGSLADLDSCY